MATRQEHVTFWQALSEPIQRGVQVSEALRRARAAVKDAALGKAIDAVAADVQANTTMADAFKKHEAVFSSGVVVLLWAGEIGGVMAPVLARIVQGVTDGALSVPGAPPPEKTTSAGRFFREFGLLLSSGVPILRALNVAAADADDPRLRDAAAAMSKAVMDGQMLSTAMQPLGDLFPQEVVAAIETGEHGGALDDVAIQVGAALDSGKLDGLPKGLAPDAKAEATFQLIVENAVRLHASDIHIEPAANDSGRIRLRVDGCLREVQLIPAGQYAQFIARLKILSALDPAERRLPQDARMLTAARGKKLEIRVSIVPVLNGERVVMRLLPQDIILGLDRMRLTAERLEQLRKLCHIPSGVVLCTGPAGSGKTTLLYGMLTEVDRNAECVMTIEDPVEFSFEGMGQIQVSPQTGMTFARALRHILRQDPDVIMIGEIRDLETMQAAITAALTGHLVLTTLHTNTAPGALRRLLDIGIEAYRLNSSVQAVIAQRLCRSLCECKKPAAPKLHDMPLEAARWVQAHPEATFFEPGRCDKCTGSGYRGRIAIHEILMMDDRVRQSVQPNATTGDIRNAAVASGMKSMLIDGLEQAAAGTTSIAEVVRVATLFAEE